MAYTKSEQNVTIFFSILFAILICLALAMETSPCDDLTYASDSQIRECRIDNGEIVIPFKPDR